MISFTVSSQTDMETFAVKLAKLCAAKDVIALFGTLGMGKTVFARAFIRELSTPDEEVPSPTFTLVQTYDISDKSENQTTVWHFDLYRLKDAEEVYELGYEEALGDGITLIEWPERAGRLLPRSYLELQITSADTAEARKITLIPHGAKWEHKLEKLHV